MVTARQTNFKSGHCRFSRKDCRFQSGIFVRNRLQGKTFLRGEILQSRQDKRAICATRLTASAQGPINRKR
jgi:hypothetical protein